MLHGLNVLVELLQRHIQDNMDSTTTTQTLLPFLQQIIKRSDQLYGLLKLDLNSTQGKVQLTFGDIIPLGFHRLKIVEFFCSLVRTNYKCIVEVLTKAGVITSCLVRNFIFFLKKKNIHLT